MVESNASPEAGLCLLHASPPLLHLSCPRPQVAAAMPQPEQLAARAAAQGRLWANVFGCMMEEGRYEVRGNWQWQVV